MNAENIIFFNLNQIYSTKGRDKNSWKELFVSVKKCTSYPGIIHYFNQRLINEPSNSLNLDILDFLIDYGPINLLREISKIDLMINIFNLLKKSSGSGVEVQKKGIYLTKKWFEIANNHREENFEGFIRNYQELNNKGISFPPPGYKLNTYEQYISNYEINKLLVNLNFFENNDNNKNFIHNFSKITPFEQESKYNNNIDIPSNDLPKLNNYENHSNYLNNKMNNNFNIRKNNNINYEMNNNNFSSNDYFDNQEKTNDFHHNNIKEIEENYQDSNPFQILDEKVKFPEKFEDKFSDLRYSSSSDKPEKNNMENNKYPKYDEILVKNNNKYLDNDKETPIGVDLYSAPSFNDVSNTPMGNKNPNPISNKQNKTIYNSGFKSYLDVIHGNKNKNNNNINININNKNIKLVLIWTNKHFVHHRRIPSDNKTNHSASLRTLN